ncbi:MAG TPA: PGF-pre-PGF domain-containing protein [archaeon]|nr:PGF-pre-PGF domain-containing protein [archaeon]
MADRRLSAVLVVSILAIFLYSITVFSTSFNSSVSPSQIVANDPNKAFNFTITNLNDTQNITQVNITLPQELTFVTGSASTNATNYTFISYANWTNTTPNLISVSSVAWFAFNATVPPINKTVNFTIYTLDSTGIVNQTNNSITILPENISINMTTGVGIFNGTLAAYANYYHTFTFNTSAVDNSTGVVATLSWSSSSKDIDLFLFDELGNMIEKSIYYSPTGQSLQYNYLPKNKLWSLRIYGNISQQESYTGKLYFSTLNITNSSNQLPSLLDFDVMNVSDSKNMTNIDIINIGELNESNVFMVSDINHVDRFSNSGNKNFTFFIPTATYTKVRLNWTGTSNYTLNLYGPDGSLTASSSNKYANAKFVGAPSEEFVEITSPSAGIWIAEANANSGSDTYTLAIYQRFSSSDWIKANYTTFTFNKSGSVNSTNSFYVNFTIPTNSFNGLYEGFLQYQGANQDDANVNNSVVKIPLKVNVTSPTLVVNNSFQSLSKTIDENYGADLTRTVYFNISNPGFYDMSLTFTNSSNMTCVSGSCSGFYANMTHNLTATVAKGSFAMIAANATFNSTFPQGVYEGWILVNGTGSSEQLSTHPYKTFNITLRLNLTNVVNLKLVDIRSAGGDNVVNSPTIAQNSTVTIRIFYVNGTEISSAEAGNLTAGNFSLWLVEGNVSYRIPSTGNLTLYNGTNPLNTGSLINLSFTVPANQVGGQYILNSNLGFTRGDNKSFSGTASNGSLIINETGLFSQIVTATSYTLNNGTSSLVNITVKNYGFADANGAKIKMFDSTLTSTSFNSSNCGGTAGAEYTLALLKNNISGCYIAWNLNAGSLNSTTTVWINYTAGKWYFNRSLIVTINLAAGSSSTSQDQTGLGGGIATVVKNSTSVIAIIDAITPGNNVISIGTSTVVPVNKITINSKIGVVHVRVTLTNFNATLPSGISTAPTDNVYKYFQVTPQNITDANINNATISFFIEKAWFTVYNMDNSTVKLSRYSGGQWNDLTTKKTTDDTNFVYYEAVSPGFSVFSISAKQKTATLVQNLSESSSNTTNATSQNNLFSGLKLDTLTIAAILIAAGAACFVGYYLFTPSRSKKGSNPSGGSGWNDLKKKWQREKASAGWDKFKKKWRHSS